MAFKEQHKHTDMGPISYMINFEKRIFSLLFLTRTLFWNFSMAYKIISCLIQHFT